MSKLILPGKSYVILFGENSPLEAQLARMGERMGFRYLKASSTDELQEILGKVKNLIALLYGRGESNILPIFPGISEKLVEFKPSDAPVEILKKLQASVIKSIPAPLTDLIRSAISDVGSQLLGNSHKRYTENPDYSLHFTNLITCDTSAEQFSAKAVCEVNFEKLRKSYQSLETKADSQLVDLFGEYCNQVLGVINFGLRPIGLSPLISLPIGAELSSASRIAQVDYMPMFRLIDSNQVFCVGVGVQIGANCSARWNELIAEATKGESEFL